MIQYFEFLGSQQFGFHQSLRFVLRNIYSLLDIHKELSGNRCTTMSDIYKFF